MGLCTASPRADGDTRLPFFTEPRGTIAERVPRFGWRRVAGCTVIRLPHRRSGSRSSFEPHRSNGLDPPNAVADIADTGPAVRRDKKPDIRPL